MVMGAVVVTGASVVTGAAVVSGALVVTGAAVVDGAAVVTGTTVVAGASVVAGAAVVSDVSVVAGTSVVDGTSMVVAAVVFSSVTTGAGVLAHATSVSAASARARILTVCFISFLPFCIFFVSLRRKRRLTSLCLFQEKSRITNSCRIVTEGRIHGGPLGAQLPVALPEHNTTYWNIRQYYDQYNKSEYDIDETSAIKDSGCWEVGSQ